ncbi:hypothetical protein KIW84_014055 [Lathyrus oleraceus]|uniref:Uncharacterized protein n=1 Tax=Pisum sativum TaxID=3888 RepID=A0A9D5BMB6_PEA|nr:hypothetical protein KIW84_014055 [Pisum sativum]
MRGADPRDNSYRGYCYNKRPKFKINLENVALDIHTKKAVVTLLSYSGEQELTQCCVVIIENDASNCHTVLTSAKLIQCRTEQNVLEDKLADSLKVIIYLYDSSSYEGQVCAHDFHYNITWIQFQSDSSFPTARIRQVDDYINVNPAQDKSSHLRPHSTHFNLVPGHAIVAVGRYFTKPFDLMAAPGEFDLVI